MSILPRCPQCHSGFTYEDRDLLVCPECGHEWEIGAGRVDVPERPVVKDANGSDLHEGDNATLIKDLKVKGGSSVLKIGTRIRINRIVDGDHNIDCHIDKGGEMMLKSEFVKKK